MNNLIIQIMISISEVMETMFYIPVEPRDGLIAFEESGLPGPDRLEAATITFHGMFSGTIELIIPSSLLMIMTENFMGEKRQHLTQKHLEGTLKETLNMLAGNTFSKVDSQSSFCLGVPELNTSAIKNIDASREHESRIHYTAPLFVVDTLDGPMGIKVNVN
ncbi:MAG: chemotaxis protein CheX [Desulfamplus sp.]|nr:chemotaxis protein CheX [Desulfamplus sp.]